VSGRAGENDSRPTLTFCKGPIMAANIPVLSESRIIIQFIIAWTEETRVPACLGNSENAAIVIKVV
jgi:hypothetical protein